MQNTILYYENQMNTYLLFCIHYFVVQVFLFFNRKTSSTQFVLRNSSDLAGASLVSGQIQNRAI